MRAEIRESQAFVIDKAFHDPANQTNTRKLGFVTFVEEGSVVTWEELLASFKRSWENLDKQMPEHLFELV